MTPETVAAAGVERSVDPFSRRGRRVLLGLLALTVVARFVALETDPPHTIVSDSGIFLTDEGWWSKSAQLRVRFGEAASQYDPILYGLGPLTTWLQVGVFKVLGVSLLTLRLLAVVCSLVSLGAFYAICRPQLGRGPALAACLVVSTTLSHFAFSRMGICEPIGTAFALSSLALWCRFRQHTGALIGSLVCAAAAFFVKVSFAYTVVAAVMLGAWDALALARSGRRGRALLHGALIAGAVAAIYAGYQAAAAWVPWVGDPSHGWGVDRVSNLTVARLLESELLMLLGFWWRIGAKLLVPVCGVAGVAWIVLRRRRLRPGSLTRTTAALCLWGAGGAALFGLDAYQPVRYFYFLLFPVAFLAVGLLRDLFEKRGALPAIVGLLALHVATQVPPTLAWLGRDELSSHVSMARDVAGRLEPDAEGRTALVGDMSGFVSLFDARVRPLDARNDFVVERLGYWRPRYLLCIESDTLELLGATRELVERIEPLASYRVLGNYWRREPGMEHEDHTLYRIHYRD